MVTWIWRNIKGEGRAGFKICNLFPFTNYNMELFSTFLSKIIHESSIVRSILTKQCPVENSWKTLIVCGILNACSCIKWLLPTLWSINAFKVMVFLIKLVWVFKKSNGHIKKKKKLMLLTYIIVWFGNSCLIVKII